MDDPAVIAPLIEEVVTPTNTAHPILKFIEGYNRALQKEQTEIQGYETHDRSRRD